MKTWCSHIEWRPMRKHAKLKYADKCDWFLNRHRLVLRSWKVCPICGAERPTRANIAAAELRAAMDAGDEE